MNIDILNMCHKIVDILGEEANQYSDDAVIWIVGLDGEFFDRIILLLDTDEPKLMLSSSRYTDDYINIVNQDVISTIVGYGYLNGIKICYG